MNDMNLLGWIFTGLFAVATLALGTLVYIRMMTLGVGLFPSNDDE